MNRIISQNATTRGPREVHEKTYDSYNVNFEYKPVLLSCQRFLEISFAIEKEQRDRKKGGETTTSNLIN
jgi:hypothetical protein